MEWGEVGRGGEMGGYEFLVSLVGFLFSGTGLTVWTEGHSSPVLESDPPPFLMGERGVDRTPAYLGIFSSLIRMDLAPSVLRIPIFRIFFY